MSETAEQSTTGALLLGVVAALARPQLAEVEFQNRQVAARGHELPTPR